MSGGNRVSVVNTSYHCCISAIAGTTMATCRSGSERCKRSAIANAAIVLPAPVTTLIVPRRPAANQASEALDAAAGNAHDAYPPVPRNLQRYRLRYDWDVEGGRREYIGPVTETDIRRFYEAQIATFGEKRIRPNYDRTMQRFREYEARKAAVDRRFNVPVLEKRDNDAWQRINELEVLIVRTPARTVRGLADKMQVMATTYLPTGYAEMPDDELDDEQRMMLAVVQDSLRLADAG